MQIEKHMMEQQIQETTSDLIEAERELTMSQCNSPAPSVASRSSKRDLEDAVVVEKLRREHDWMMQVSPPWALNSNHRITYQFTHPPPPPPPLSVADLGQVSNLP